MVDAIQMHVVYLNIGRPYMMRILRQAGVVYFYSAELEDQLEKAHHQNSVLTKMIKSYANEEEKINLEMAFLEEERGECECQHRRFGLMAGHLFSDFAIALFPKWDSRSADSARA